MNYFVVNGSAMNVACCEHGLLLRVVSYEGWSFFTALI